MKIDFSPKAWAEAWRIVQNEFALATFETLYLALLSTAIAVLIGMPLGIILVTGRSDGIRPLPKWLMKTLDIIINILRSVPFIILVVLVLPLTRFIMGTTVGTLPFVVPLVIAAFPFIARLTESSMREVDPNVIEMAQSMGASPLQIVFKVMIPESVPSLIANFTLAFTTILGFTAMSGVFGGGGLGKIAITYGYNRYKYIVLLLSVALLVILVHIIQSFGTYLSVKLDKRIKNKKE